MSDLLFLLGAGFNKDARGEVDSIIGRSIYVGEYEIEVDYPLVADLASICFGDENFNNNVSVEEKLSEAISNNNYKPLEALYNEIMKADYYIVPQLISKKESCYHKFFNKFKDSSFLTFNYDSLVNIFLLRLGRWHPFDGYGIPVETEIERAEQGNASRETSSCLVLHLHGSLCTYTVDFKLTSRPGNHVKWISLKEPPDFLFDPDAISNLFYPYTRAYPGIGYMPVERRVIAPIPDKTEGLKAKFIRQVHAKAKSLLESADILVSIGYSYNPLDKSFYEHLIHHFVNTGGRKVLVIGPDADNITKRLSELFGFVEWEPIKKTFKQWVEDDFSNIDRD